MFFDVIVLSFVACKTSLAVFGDNILKIFNSIRLPSAPESILHVIHTLP